MNKLTYGTSVKTGTDALIISLMALGIKKDDEIITVANTAIPTISAIKLFPTDHKSLDITFPDRYSFCAINSTEILKLNTKSLRELSLKFYNDTFLVDQNASFSQKLSRWKRRLLVDARAGLLHSPSEELGNL